MHRIMIGGVCLLVLSLNTVIFAQMVDEVSQQELEAKSPEDTNHLSEATNLQLETDPLQEKVIMPNENRTYVAFQSQAFPVTVSLGVLKYFTYGWSIMADVGVGFPLGANDKVKVNLFLDVNAAYSFFYLDDWEIALFFGGGFFFDVSGVYFEPYAGFRFFYDFFYVNLGYGYVIGGDTAGSKLITAVGFRF